MRKIIILFSMIILFNINVCNVYAKCINEDIIKVTELSKNIQVNYEFVGEKSYDGINQSYAVSFNFGDLENEVYAKEVNEKNLVFYKSNDGKIIDAGSYNFDIYYNGCEGIKVNTINVDLKKYNKYSLRDECNGLQGKLDVCDEWYQGNVTENIFMNVINDYQSKNFVINENTIQKNIYWIIGGLGCFVVLLIIILVIRAKRNRLD